MSFADFARAFFALAFTLGLVGLAAYGARRFGPEWLVRLQRPKADRRMTIVESLPLDPARRLVLVRLDSTERLLLLGEGRMVGEARDLGEVAAAPPEPTGASPA